MIKKFFVFLLGVLSTLYLLNPGWGVFELLPDNLTVIGNLDEAGATALLLWCLRYFGLDVLSFLRRVRGTETEEPVIDVEARRVPPVPPKR